MKRHPLALSLAGLLLAPAAGAVFAQTAAPQDQQTAQQAAPQNAKQLQTITVTGSALPRVDTETPSPVTVITAQDIARSGYTTISDVVRSVSADNSGTIPNAFTNGFAAGASGVALRGLTVNSTLVLVDGHRVANYPVADDGERSFVDLNTIPLAAVERVEVLKDGASSLYGADAIAGVVNIILRPTFKGIEGTAEVGSSQHGGGWSRKASLLMGGGDLNTDHYNAYFSAQYQKDNPIWARQRKFPFNTGDLSSLGGANANSSSPGNGSIYGAVAPGTLGTPGNILTGTATGLYQPLRGCGGDTVLVNDPANGVYCQQNFVGDYGQVQPAMEQGGLYGRITVKINDTTKAFLSTSYMEARTWTVGPPAQIQSGTPNNTTSIALPPTLPDGSLNPNNPFAASGQYALINYAFGDIPNGFNYDNHNLRLTGGVSGTWSDWNYDITATINHDWLHTSQFGFLNYQALITAVTDGTYNFVNPAANSAAIRSTLAPGYSKTSTSDLDALDFNVSRSLWDLPGGPMGLALGAGVRHEANDDPTLNPNFEFQGLGNAQTKGRRNVVGAYVEFDMPLIESLEVDASGRFDHYSDFGNNFSPKVGFKWKPFDWIAVRGTYSKGFRAPAFAENGSSSSQGFITAGGLSGFPDSFIAAHTGPNGPSAYVTIPYAQSIYALANPKIKPEKATNFTFGVVVQPISWFNASIDYYHIEKDNVITQADTSSALNNYYAGLPQAPGVVVVPDLPDPAFPNAQPRPLEVIGEYINANKLKTSGVDVDLRGHWDFGDFHYTSEFTGTEIFTWKLYLPDGSVQQYVGTHGPYILSSGAGTPRFRESWANTFQYGPLPITGPFYRTSGMDNYAEDTAGKSCLNVLPLSCHVGSYVDFDLTGSYDINNHISVMASVMNAFDRKPPLDPADYAGAGANYNPTWAQSGIVGRFWNVGVKLKF